MSDATPTTASREGLGHATLTGLRWVTLARGGAEVLGLASTVVLARLIAPDEFGRVAVTLIVLEIALALAGHGFGAALVQRARLRRADVQTAFALALFGGVLLAGLTFAVGPLIANALYDHETAVLFQIAAVAFLLAAPSAIAESTLSRAMNFRAISLAELAGIVTGILVSVALALAGLGAAALLLGRLGALGVTAAIQSRAARLPAPRLHRESLRELTSFGGNAAGGALVWSFHRNVDFALVGAALGPAQAGLYWRAFNLAVEYQTKITSIMQRVSFPVFSRAESLDDMRTLRYRIVRVHAAAIVPLVATLAVTAPVLIPLVYGSRWESAVVPTQIMCAMGALYPISSGLGSLMLAAGLPRLLLAANLAQLAGYVAAIAIGAQFGLVGVAVASVLATATGSLLVHYFVLERRIGVPLRQVWHEVRPGVLGSLVLLVVGWATMLAGEQLGLPEAAIAAAAIGVGLGTYAAVLRFVFYPAWADLTLVAKRVLPDRLAGPLRAGRARLKATGDPWNAWKLWRYERHPDRAMEDPDVVRLRFRAFERKPISLRVGAMDRYALRDTVEGRYHRPPRELVAPPERIWDLGSNIGLTIADMAIRHPDAQVVGVELDAENARLCRTNIAPWGDRCRLVDGAVWSEDGWVPYDRESGNEQGFHVTASEPDAATHRARAVSLDGLLEQCEWPWVDYVKMDIEGAEETVLRQNTGWAERVRAIKVEVHEPYSVEACLVDLERLGFDARPDDRHPACVVGLRAPGHRPDAARHRSPALAEVSA